MVNIVSPCKFCGQDVRGSSMPLSGAFHPECLAASMRVQPRGCICPPASEQTCKNPMCPRGALPLRTT